MHQEKYIRTKLRSANPVASYLHRIFLSEKLNNWIGYFLIAGVAVTFGYLLSKDLKLGLGVLGMLIGISVILICVLDTEMGLYINMAYAFVAVHISRLLFNDELPIGIITDILVASTFMGLFLGKYNLKKNTPELFKSRPVIYFLITFFYLCLELLNPEAHSFEGWFQIIRKVLETIVFLFIAYNVLGDYKAIRKFFKVLFFCALATALYGCIQQWHGLFPFELAWVASDPVRFELIYILGSFRKFSFLTGPTELGIMMAACALLFMIIGINEKKSLNKYVLIGGSIIMMLAMSYSGTRTANAMIVGGAVMFILLTIANKKTKIFALFAVLAFLFLMYVPIYDNLTLLRFRTSFKASEDASYNVRETNRARIRPYIHTHPFGGGLSTTGEGGKKYNPGHPLAGFPPDSSYLNKTLELGWVGLTLTCLLYFVTLQAAVHGFFTSKNNKTKILFAASAAFLFSLYIGEIAQEAVGLFSNMVVYYPILAIIVRLNQWNSEKLNKDVDSAF